MPNIVVKSGEARIKFRDLLDQVLTGKGDVIIERHGKSVAVLISAAEYEQLRGKLETMRSVRETAAAYKTLKAGQAIINTEEGTATISLDWYNNVIAEREARFAVIKEIQDAQEDRDPEEVERDVAEAIERVRRRNASSSN